MLAAKLLHDLVQELIANATWSEIRHANRFGDGI